MNRCFLRRLAALARALPGTVHVYGETGKREGGPFPPHRTHRNGTSVDFMVPVRDADGDSVPLPTWPWNRFGYDLEFTLDGRLDFDVPREPLWPPSSSRAPSSARLPPSFSANPGTRSPSAPPAPPDSTARP